MVKQIVKDPFFTTERKKKRGSAKNSEMDLELIFFVGFKCFSQIAK